MIPPSPGPQLMALLKALAETVAIAFLGTMLAAILSFPLGLLAARNTTVNKAVKFLTRRFSRHDPRRGHADLGADLDQRRGPGTVLPAF